MGWYTVLLWWMEMLWNLLQFPKPHPSSWQTLLRKCYYQDTVKTPKQTKTLIFTWSPNQTKPGHYSRNEKWFKSLKSDDQAELPPHATMSARTPAVPPAQIRRASFSQVPSHTPIRRTKSEGHARGDVTSARLAQSAVPEICADATVNDCFWRKLEVGNHHGSISYPLVSVQVTLPLKSI